MTSPRENSLSGKTLIMSRHRNVTYQLLCVIVFYNNIICFYLISNNKNKLKRLLGN